MRKQPFQTVKNQRVRLKRDGQDGIYQYARAGAEGWVRGQKHDQLGYPMVKIEWDKLHWTYDGEPDQWTFEAHFEPVEEPEKMSDTPQGGMPPELVQGLMAWLSTQNGAPAQPEPEAEEPVEQQDGEAITREQYQAILARAAEFARDAEAMLVIAVGKEEMEGVPVLSPRMWTAYMAPEPAILLEMQLSKIAAAAHQEAGWMAIQSITDKKSKGDE